MTTTTPSTNNSTQTKLPLLPPDQKFWKRYSPHHEFPLSGIGSIAIHCVVGGLLILAAWATMRFTDNPLPVEPIIIAGGGGNPKGTEGGMGVEVPTPGPEASQDPKEETKPGTPKPVESGEPIPEAKAQEIDIPELKDVRYLQKASSATQALANISEKARNELLNAVPPPPKGQGGKGTGGGEGNGRGTGKGDGQGPGDGTKGKLSVRQKRAMRWVVDFGKINGEEYRQRLRGLKAILAIPTPQGGHRVIRDLTPPVKGKIENVKSIQRIFWIDDRPESVASLGGALGLQFPPPYIAAFFPEDVETLLLEKEKKFQGKSEEEIQETRFTMTWDGRTYDFEVVSQR